jgi:transglutaminase-like putative cysteine protease
VIAVVIVILILFVLLVPQIRTPLFEAFNPTSYREYPQSVEFTVERNIEITNVLDHTVDIPRPEDFSNLQQVISVSTSPSYDPLNKYGNEWMVWDENGNADIKITYRMRTETAVWDIGSEDVMTLSEAMNDDTKTGEDFRFLVTKYNHKEWKIDPTLPEVTSLASQLDTGGTIYDQIKSIFDYLDKNFEYRTVDRGEVKSPTQTLQDGNGDCDDMSFLFISISRAMGIPSWVELGSLYDEQNNQWVGHAWISLYLPLKTGQSGLVNVDVVNREFLIRGANRFSDWKSDGGYQDDGDGIIDDTEWHLYDYYYMYLWTPIGNTYYSDESTALAYQESGSVNAKLGGDQSMPGFEALLLIPVILAAFVMIQLARRRQKR